MLVPQVISHNALAWNTSTTPRAITAFNALAGDIIVAWALAESNSADTISNDGAALTWVSTSTVISVANYCWLTMWTTKVDTDRTPLTLTGTRTGGSAEWGLSYILFRGSAGIGARGSTNTDNVLPVLQFTPQGINSAIVVAFADWQAKDGATRVYLTNFGAFTEESEDYLFTTSHYTVYGGLHLNSGAIQTANVGLGTMLAGMRNSIAAIEVLGMSNINIPKPGFLGGLTYLKKF